MKKKEEEGEGVRLRGVGSEALPSQLL